jgi:hypothetical protein
VKPNARWARRSERRATHENAKAMRAAKIVRTIQREAKENGATLANDGKGGLDPALALEVFRRDGYRCTNEDCPTPKKNLDLDHISGHAKEIEEDPKARKNPTLKKGVKLGHVDKAAALHVLCEACHTESKRSVHARENSIEDGKKPPPMRGDRRGG